MKIDELEVSLGGKKVEIEYHSTLNPLFWHNGRLDPIVSNKLLEIAEYFARYLEIGEAHIKDVVITGSNASYNWSDYSDLDLHLIIDAPLSRVCLNDKRALWATKHNIKIYGVPVECYPQDVDEAHYDTGTYSLKNSKWIKFPVYKPFEYDDQAVISKSQNIAKQIDELGKDNPSDVQVNILIKKIADMRKCGLEREGEGSVENIVFKILRASGYIEKLRNYSFNAVDQSLSL